MTLFVFLFGGAIKGESRHTYLQYVLPGIMVMTVLFASIGTGIGLNTDVTKGIFDRFRSLPISRSAPLTGTIMGDFVRYVVSIAMVFAYGRRGTPSPGASRLPASSRRWPYAATATSASALSTLAKLIHAAQVTERECVRRSRGAG